MESISAKNQRTKMQSIEAFFNDFDKKAGYLVDLYNSDHRDEARILCSCYIDGLASALYWPDHNSNFNYVKSLMEHGGNAIFSHIHPKMLDDAFHRLVKRGSKKWSAIHGKISGELRRADRRLYGKREIVDLITSLLQTSEIAIANRELWRGTFAAIVYERFRIAAVHRFGPPDGTTFDGSTFQGEPVPAIDFFMVHDCLNKIIGVARESSQKTGKLFGHDYECTDHE